MDTSKKTKALLETYYSGFAQKKGWESVISDTFRFTADSMEKTNISIGKESYMNIIARFSQLYQKMHVKKMIVEGNNASVIANYEYLFPNGKRISGDVAEFWEVKDGKLDALVIYFDTLTFDKNTPK